MNHYATEAHMRAAHPYIASHLVTIAVLVDGVYRAETAKQIYTWNAIAQTPPESGTKDHE